MLFPSHLCFGWNVGRRADTWVRTLLFWYEILNWFCFMIDPFSVRWFVFPGLSATPLMVDDFRDVRGTVKGKRNGMCGEGVVISVEVVTNLVDRVPCALMCVDRITLKGRLLFNLAETRGFYSADFFRGSGSSAEPVVLTRATHIREQIMANVGRASRGIFSVSTQSGQVILRNQCSMC
tara:strand:+ start:1410 stop:1946 length:537 start_codon:yes stop_codon:yes gene_type:complete